MNPTDLRSTLTRLFGPLHENEHPCYSEISGDVLWTENFISPGGTEYMLAFTICEADEEEDSAYFMVDFWWVSPLMVGQMGMWEIPRFDPKNIGVYKTVVDAEHLKVLLDTVHLRPLG